MFTISVVALLNMLEVTRWRIPEIQIELNWADLILGMK